MLAFVTSPILCLPTYFVFHISEFRPDNHTQVYAVNPRKDSTWYRLVVSFKLSQYHTIAYSCKFKYCLANAFHCPIPINKMCYIEIVCLWLHDSHNFRWKFSHRKWFLTLTTSTKYNNLCTWMHLFRIIRLTTHNIHVHPTSIHKHRSASE